MTLLLRNRALMKDTWQIPDKELFIEVELTSLLCHFNSRAVPQKSVSSQQGIVIIVEVVFFPYSNSDRKSLV